MNNEDKNSSPQPKTDLHDSATYTQDVPSDISMSEQRDDGIGAGKKQKPQHLLSRWWRNKKARYGTIIFLFVFAVVIMLLPLTRYFVLNSVGVRSSLSITVIDKASNQALRQATVSINGASSQTDDNGNATVQKVKQGSGKIIIEKKAYAKLEIPVTVGWGSNPQGKVFVQPTGVQYTIFVKDWLSGNPIEKVEATAGQANALSDKDGKIVLTLDQEDYEKNKTATVKKDLYRDEQVDLDATDKFKDVIMAPSRRHMSVTKKSGKYDVMSGYIDGKDDKVLLTGTGYEKEDLALIEHPEKNLAVYISSRDNKRTSKGILMSSLMIIDEETGASRLTSTIGQSERYQPVGWMKDNFIYAFLNNGVNFDSPELYKLMSYDYQTGQSKQIATANYFNDIMIFGDRVLYTTGFAGDNKPQDKIGLFSVNSQGGDSKRLMDQETWNMLRTGYQTVAFTTGTNWFEYKLGAAQVSTIAGAPAIQKTRIYSDHPTQKKSLWIDERDGKGVLLAYDISTGKDSVLYTVSGLKQPTQWLSTDVVFFRVSNSQETADYAISQNGGSPKKIRDVTNANGADYWLQQY